MKSFALLLFVSLIWFSKSAKLPSTFQICKRNDPKLNECFKSAVQNALPQLKNGLPALNLIPIEPIEIQTMVVESASASVNLMQKYDNIKIYNVSNAIVDKAEIEVSETGDTFKSTIYITMPYTTTDSDYDFDGKVMMLPIKGNGKCSTKMENTKVIVKLSGGRVDKKGVAHLKVDDASVSLQPGSAEFHFDNLFSGDEGLGTEMNKLINENWKDLFDEVRGGYQETLASLFKNTANTIFNKIPLDEIFPQ